MHLIHDAASAARALALDLDPRLRCILEAHIAALTAREHDLTDETEFLVITAGDGEEAVAREVGFSPLVEPVDGARFGKPGFAPYWDWLADLDGWFEMIVTFGSTASTILLIEDAEGTLPALRRMCRAYA